MKMTYNLNLVKQSLDKQILADKDYINKKLKQNYYAIGIDLWTPQRKNQPVNKKVDIRLLVTFQKRVEIIISRLSSLRIQQFKNYSLLRFKTHLEAILLIYCFMFEKAQTIISDTLKCSIGCF